MKIILASQSGVRKKILDKYKIKNEVIISNVDEEEINKIDLCQSRFLFVRFLVLCLHRIEYT